MTELPSDNDRTSSPSDRGRLSLCPRRPRPRRSRPRDQQTLFARLQAGLRDLDFMMRDELRPSLCSLSSSRQR